MYYGVYTMVLYSMVEKRHNGYELVVFSGHCGPYLWYIPFYVQKQAQRQITGAMGQNYTY